MCSAEGRHLTVALTTFHLSLTTSATDRMSVFSAAPLIPTDPSSSHPLDFTDLLFSTLINHCTVHTDSPVKYGR